MNSDLGLLTALILGLLGSAHCIAMCGGIVAALSLKPATDHKQFWKYQLVYNLGRLSSYTVAGALVGFAGSGLVAALNASDAARWGQLIAAIFLLLLGFYLMGLNRALAPLESLGNQVWKHIEPLGKKLLPVRNTRQALSLGLLWGWLPCGLVYSVLPLALASGSAPTGALIMLVFGLGTLPSLLLTGFAATSFGELVNNIWVRRSAGATVLIFGAVLIFLSGQGHHESMQVNPSAEQFDHGHNPVEAKHE